MLSPSANYDPNIASEYNLTHPDPRFVHPGYPCHDVLYREIPDELEKVTTKKFSKVYLWMPTFRKGGGYCRNDSTAEFPYGIPLVENEQMMNELQKFLEENNSLLVIKVHPMQDPDTLTLLHGSDNILVLTGQTVKELGVDNYRLIKSADALISDYSSIAYSYLLLNRPMAFVLSDLKDYKLGLSVEDPEPYLAGQKIFTFDDMLKFLKDVIEGRDEYVEKRHALQDYLFDHRDGNAARRLAEFMGLEQ
jgi:CDP-glycerol glycerophosphotransferase (TagB/SpsB family)